jgi:hypothetical protein
LIPEPTRASARPAHPDRQIAKVTSAGVEISEPFALDTKWDYAGFVDPSRAAVGTW